MQPAFSSPDLLDCLEGMNARDFDGLAFGVIAMSASGYIVAYNQAEALLSGLTAARVIGRHFFTSVAPCANNQLVAQPFESQPTLDLTIDYVFTLRMAPTPVQLRLLKHPKASRMYLAVRRRDADAS